MATDADPPRRSGAQVVVDEERLAEIAAELADAVERVVPAWIEGLVLERVRQWRGEVSPEVVAEAVAAGEVARDDLAPRIRRLLRADIDDQRANPLELLRATTRHAGVVLEGLGVPPIERDQFAVRSFPDDVHGLMPATWADVHDDLHELGIAWGAAKAYVHKARRRDEGMT